MLLLLPVRLSSALGPAVSVNHTEVGHACVGAKSNGRIVPLRTHLRNGDILEIITQTGHTPSSDWLNLVKTSRARNKIKHWLNTHRRKKAEEIGVKLLEKEARRLRVSLKKVKPEVLEKVCRDYGCPQAADLHAGLGYGRYSARQVLSKLFPDDIAAPGPSARSKPADALGGAASEQADGLVVTGIDDILVYRAGCCNPIRGEPIVGYVTRGKGVAVHSRGCPNVENLMYESERRIDVEWARSGDLLYKSRLLIEVSDRAGILNDLTTVLTNESVNISSVESRTNDSKGNAAIEMTIAVGDVKQLDRIVAAMQRVPDVWRVVRSAG